MALYAEKSIEIDASPTRVWEVLTSDALTSQWAGEFGATGPIESTWQLDSPVRWRNAQGEVYVEGRVTALVPHELLRFTVRATEPEMQPISGREEDDITQTYSLSTQRGRTVLAITHGDFAKLRKGDEIFPKADAGWDKILAKLKGLAEASASPAPRR